MRVVKRWPTRLISWLGIALFAAACATAPPEPTPIPTDTPSPTPPPPTATITRTPFPTATPGIRPETIASDPAQQVYLRLVHAAPDVASVDIYIELLAVATNLNFGRATESTGIVAGSYALKIVPAGFGPDEQIIVQTRLTLQGSKSYILLFSGTTGTLTLSPFEENVEPLNSGESRVNVIHAVPRGVDFVLREGNNNLTAPVSFGQQSTPVILPSGIKNMIFLAGGNVLQTAAVDLRPRHNHTLILLGRGEDPSSLAVIEFSTRVTGRTTVRVINGSTALSSIDVTLNDALLAQNVGFGRASERSFIPANVYTVSVFAAGVNRAEVAPLTSTQLNANPDDIISLIVIGSAEDLRVVTRREDLSATASTQTRIAFMNAVPSVPRVRVELAGGPVPGVPDMGYGQVTAETVLSAGLLDFYWKAVESSGEAFDILEIANNVLLDAGRTYLYLFTGRIDTPPLIFSENVAIDNSLLPVDPDAVLVPTPTAPTRVRFINALASGTFVDFLVDDTPLVTGITAENGSGFSQISAGDRIITVRNLNGGTLLARLEYAFDQPGNYSVVVFGSETATQIELLVVPDFNLLIDNQSSHLRLINVTQDGFALLGLGYGAPLDSVPVFSEEENYRQSIPLGVTRLLRDIENGQFSSQARGVVGTHSIVIFDTDRSAIAAYIPRVNLEIGVHYDVIAYQETGSLLVHTFIVPYPNG